jgi:hypothetical protein
MTPEQHATAADAELNKSTAPGARVETRTRYARIALVHAVLATKAGTGSDYTDAETLLAAGAASDWSPYLLDQALVHAHLAESAA